VTIDHIANGRFALNLVMGWFRPESEMFGGVQRDHADRYRYGAEWIEVCKQLWAGEHPFDHQGDFFDISGAEAGPRPVQRPWPLLVGAGASPSGQEFAARNLDFNFISIETLDTVPAIVASVNEKAAAAGRELGIASYAHVICRDTEAEAWAAYEDTLRYADWEAAGNMMHHLGMESRSFPELRKAQATDAVPEELRKTQERMVIAAGGYPIVGSPEQVVSELQRISDAGVNGMCLTFLDYNEELKYFDAKVMPLLREAGLRH
jgi:dimethylsulfone monooxygenase